jgi:hypothetical protein
MIALAADCLVFEMARGESIPLSVEMISVELMGETAELFDAEFVKHASHAVFHHFKNDLGKKSVCVAEFAEALEKVLRGFALVPQNVVNPPRKVMETDLRQIAFESGKGCELFFFPRLREEFDAQMRQSPAVLRFRGLRSCVKQLVGARRWTPRCERLGEQIVEYLRQCSTTRPAREFAMVVD